jgi:hypothetical protein
LLVGIGDEVEAFDAVALLGGEGSVPVMYAARTLFPLLVAAWIAKS